MSSRDAGLVDRLPPPGDEREYLTGDVALQAADRFQLGVAFCDAAGHIRFGPLIGSQSPDGDDVQRAAGRAITASVEAMAHRLAR